MQWDPCNGLQFVFGWLASPPRPLRALQNSLETGTSYVIVLEKIGFGVFGRVWGLIVQGFRNILSIPEGPGRVPDRICNSRCWSPFPRFLNPLILIMFWPKETSNPNVWLPEPSVLSRLPLAPVSDFSSVFHSHMFSNSEKRQLLFSQVTSRETSRNFGNAWTKTVFHR